MAKMNPLTIFALGLLGGALMVGFLFLHKGHVSKYLRTDLFGDYGSSSPDCTNSASVNSFAAPENTDTAQENSYIAPESDNTSLETGYTVPENSYLAPESSYTVLENSYFAPVYTGYAAFQYDSLAMPTPPAM